MGELLSSGVNTSKPQEHAAERMLYSKFLFVTAATADRYRKSSEKVGATLWYKSREGDDIDQQKWKETLQYGFMGYVQLGYQDKAMWEAFTKVEQKLAKQEDIKAREAQDRRFGVLRGTKDGFKVPNTSGVIIRFGGKYKVKQVGRLAA